MENNRIFMVAGEPSGDALGAGLIRSLHEESLEPLALSGVGGHLMEAEEGFKSLIDMNELCVMGIAEVISQLPRLHKLINALVEEIESFDPIAVVTIDLPDFNFHLAKRLKKRGKCRAKIIHYVAPSVWAWRPKRAEKIAGFLDGLMCLLPFEPDYFTKHHLESVFVGHPLINQKSKPAKGRALRQKYGIPEDATVLGLFFGSRPGEIKTLSRDLKDTARILKKKYPDLHLIVPTLPSLELDVLNILEGLDIPAYVITEEASKFDAFAACDAALAVSGTIALELAYAAVPHVIAYKVNFLSWLIVKMLVKVRYAHLANILLGDAAIPEYLQGNCQSVKIARGLFELMDSPKNKKAQKERMKEISSLLGEGHLKSPSSRAADFVLLTITAM